MRRLVSVQVVDGLLVLRGYYAHKLALEAGLRPTFSGVRSGWVTDADRLRDFMAYCQVRNVPLEVDHPDVEDLGALRDADEAVLHEADEPLFDLGDAS